jgi:uncharacterized protein YcfJ
MKKMIAISALASMSLLLANSVFAAPDHHKHHKHQPAYKPGHVHRVEYRDSYAQVVRSTPIYREVAIKVPVDSCHIESVAYTEQRAGKDSFKGTVVGGLIGAALGHEMGRNGHATAAGGLIGAALGNSVAGGSRQVTRYEDREVCTTRYRTDYQRELVGYDVTYRYDGRLYNTETRHHPGDRIVHVRSRH